MIWYDGTKGLNFIQILVLVLTPDFIYCSRGLALIFVILVRILFLIFTLDKLFDISSQSSCILSTKLLRSCHFYNKRSKFPFSKQLTRALPNEYQILSIFCKGTRISQNTIYYNLAFDQCGIKLVLNIFLQRNAPLLSSNFEYFKYFK